MKKLWTLEEAGAVAQEIYAESVVDDKAMVVEVYRHSKPEESVGWAVLVYNNSLDEEKTFYSIVVP